MIIKTVYLYDDQTGRFISEFYCQQSPLSPDEYIYPGLVYTDIAPQITANTWPVFVNNAWVNQSDHRGVVWDTATGLPIEHLELGALPAGLTITPKPDGFYHWVSGAWVPDIATAKTETKAIVNRLAREKILAVLPDWKQSNLTARAVELVSIGDTTSAEWLYIKAQWDFVKQIRAESNIITTAIDAAAALGAIATLEQDFIATLQGL